MKKTTVGQGFSLAAAMAVLILLLSAVAWAGGPEGVSPSKGSGSTGQDVAVITNPCPTFSWSEVEGAFGYRVEVYEMDNDIVTDTEISEVSFNLWLVIEQSCGSIEV